MEALGSGQRWLGLSTGRHFAGLGLERVHMTLAGTLGPVPSSLTRSGDSSAQASTLLVQMRAGPGGGARLGWGRARESGSRPLTGPSASGSTRRRGSQGGAGASAGKRVSGRQAGHSPWHAANGLCSGVERMPAGGGAAGTAHQAAFLPSRPEPSRPQLMPGRWPGLGAGSLCGHREPACFPGSVPPVLIFPVGQGAALDPLPPHIAGGEVGSRSRVLAGRRARRGLPCSPCGPCPGALRPCPEPHWVLVPEGLLF